MKKLVMALVVAASAMTMVGCAVQPVQVHGVVVDKKFIPQHDQIKDTTTAYAGRVYPGSYRMRVPNQFILVIKTPRGVAMVVDMVGSTMMTAGSSVVLGAVGYTAVAVATTTTGVADAQARRSTSRSYSGSSSRSTYSAPKPKPAPSYTAPKPSPAVTSNSSRGKAATTPAPAAAKPVAPAPSSMIGRNVSKPNATNNRVMPTRYSSTPPVNRSWNTTPAQRVSNGSMIQPLLIGAAAGIGGAMLYDWITSPSTTSTTADAATSGASTASTASTSTAATTDSSTSLQVVQPTANFKKFEGSQIPEKYQEVMKKQGLTIEPKQGEVTEYSKKIKIKDGLEITVDIAELPVLVVYVNEAGKPSEALFMPI